MSKLESGKVFSSAQCSDAQGLDVYRETLSLIERLHRQLLDMIKADLDKAGYTEVNNVQALLLHNIGDSELTAGELRAHGHYLGSNVSYNLKKLVDGGYIHHQRSEMDRRSVLVRLTPRGHAIRHMVSNLFQKHWQTLGSSVALRPESIKSLNAALRALEEFWNTRLNSPA